MTEKEKQLLFQLWQGKISPDQFRAEFPAELRNSEAFIVSELESASRNNDPKELDRVIQLIWLWKHENRSKSKEAFTDILNQLLIYPNHSNHQFIAKTLQDIKSPSTIPFVKKALEMGFDHLAYNASDDGVIAKWFSWLLYAIGTPEAIQVIRDYSNFPNEEIRDEMKYRLSTVENRE